jgi:hypothetical protein
MAQVNIPLSLTSVAKKPSSEYNEDRITLPGQEFLDANPASLGTDWNSPFNSSNTLADYVRNTPKGNLTGVYDLAANDKNEFMGISSFLYYPSDLARNRRYHHFIVFNIYQGSSDQIRMTHRNTALVESVTSTRGGVQFGGSVYGNGSDAADNITMTNIGMNADQIADYFKAKRDGFPTGPISNAKYNTWDRALQGELSNLLTQATEGRTVPVAVVQGSWAMLAGSYNSIKSDVSDFITTVLQSETMDMLSNEKDTNERGINGQTIQRPISERSILVANRRFTIAKNKSKDTISLYMPQKIAINDQLVYQEEEMGMAKTLLAAVVGKRGAGSALVEKAGTNFVAGIINKATNIAGVEDFNLQAVRNAATRSVSNPRREVMFRDVGIRSHTFSFEFSPRNSDEASTVLDIIRMFRFHAYPGLRGGGGHFFTFPAEFEASFMAIDDAGVVTVNNNLPRLPRLALTTVSVDYSGGGDFKTFRDAIPAFIKVDLGFQEMEQLTSEHVIHGY